MGGTGIKCAGRMNEEKNEKGGLKEFFQLGEVFSYFFRKKDKDNKADFSLRSMHFVNKFSMTVFLLAMLYLLFKQLFL